MSGTTRMSKSTEQASAPGQTRLLVAGSQSLAGNTSFTPFQRILGNQAILQLLESGVVQAKLRVSLPGDADELEADRVASRVVSSSYAPVLQRKCSCAGAASCSKCSGEEEEKLHRSVFSPPSIQRAAAAPSSTSVSAAGDSQTQSDSTQKPVASRSLIVEDDAPTPGPGQMKKSEFIERLRTIVCSTADAALAAVGRDSKFCPYIEQWLSFYSAQDSAHIERAFHKYAPESNSVSNAQQYFSIAKERVHRAVVTWVKTGKVTGLPPGAPLTPGNPGGSETAGPEKSGKQGAPSETGSNSNAGSAIRLKSANRTSNASTDVQTIYGRLGAGRPLDTAPRSRMESAFGQDFSYVRIHTDSQAASLSTELNARAFTLGNSIAFASGEYKPGAIVGDALLAHELAHVVQQRGGSDGPAAMTKAKHDDGPLEGEANRSALGAVLSLWSRGKSGFAELTRSAVPRLRSGVRLQRCTCERSSEVKPTAPITLNIPAVQCDPQPVTLDDIKKLPGAHSDVLGVTKASNIATGFTIVPQSSRWCILRIDNAPKFGIDHSFYTKPGTYDIGTEKLTSKKCRGKVVPQRLTVTPAFADKIRKGEIEHCEDQKRAFALSYDKYLQVYKELGQRFCSEGSDCETETKARFKARLGIDWDDQQKISGCLLDKTGVRDTSNWHTAGDLGKPAVAPDCSSVTYTPDASKNLNEIGKHKTEDLVKGCGEP
jgi:hypothetical protein